MQIRSIIKKGARIIAKTIASLILFIIIFLVAERSLSSITNTAEKHATNTVTIYLQSNGVHTDLIFPIKNGLHNWFNQIDINSTKAKDSSVQFVAIGWGDKGFYLETPSWDELKASTALKAALGMSSTAMHCTFYKQVKANKNIRKINLSDEQYNRLIAFINSSFKWENNKTVLVNTEVRYDNYDTFYEAIGNYTMFKTCNTWTNQALKSAGLKACYWAVFEKGIMAKYK